MPKLSELNSTSKVKLLLYGLSGAGKTIAACSFPKPLFLADFDGKASSALNFYGRQAVSEIEYENYMIDHAQGVDRPFNRFYTQLHNLELAVKNKAFPYKTIVVDSLTTYTDQMMAEVIKQNPGAKRVDKHTAALQDYLILGSHFKSYLGRILSLPCHVVFTAHIQQTRDEATGEIIREPMLPGKMAAQLPIMFEEVYRMYADAGKYLAQTQATKQYLARSQIKGLVSPVEFNYDVIAKQLEA